MKRAALTLLFCAMPVAVHAMDVAIGTWQKRDPKGVAMIMTIERAGAGLKITYRFPGATAKGLENMTMTIVSPLDGSEAPVLLNDKPSAETMAIKRIDGSHSVTVVKMGGQPFGTSRAELSADGKTIKVENETAVSPPGKPDKTIEYWDRR